MNVTGTAVTRNMIADSDAATEEVPVVARGGSGQTWVTSLRPPGDDPQQRRKLGGLPGSDVLEVAGSAAAAVSLAVLLFGRLTPLSGGLGFFLFTYAAFLGVYALVVSFDHDGPAVTDRIMTVVLYSGAVVMVGALLFVIVFTLWRGHAALLHTNFYTQDMSRTGPLSGLNSGGIDHALVGTLWEMGISLAIVIPLGLACAVYLTQVGGRGSKFIRTVVEAMTALPDVLAGLFVFALWILEFGFQRSGLAAALALTVTMLPTTIRAADVVLRLVPGNLREASEALGAPGWRTVRYVVLPTARSGLATSVILGIARGIGETAPVLLTAGYTAYLNKDPLQGPMVSLPLAAFEFVQSPQKTMIDRGFATAAFLLLVILVLFFIARLLGGRGPGYVSKRGAARIRRRSARDLDRFFERAVTDQRDPDTGMVAGGDDGWSGSALGVTR
jgi:phosphate transport system permease protein